MRHRRPRRSLALTVAAVALAAGPAGCGGDDVPPAPSTTTTATPTTPPPTTAPPTTAPPTTAPPTTAPPTTAQPPTAPPPTTGPTASTASDDKLRATAAAHARRTLGVTTDVGEVTLLRSRRDPAWAIASSARGRTLWVVWLRDGVGAIATKDPARFNPVGVPCDVRPAFSEPGC